jgi:hypothetical protein
VLDETFKIRIGQVCLLISYSYHMSFVHANSHTLTQFACTYLSLFFQHECLDDYDLSPHVEELALLRQAGHDFSKSMDSLLKRKKREGDVENLESLRSAVEAFPSHASKVHSFPTQHNQKVVCCCDKREQRKEPIQRELLLKKAKKISLEAYLLLIHENCFENCFVFLSGGKGTQPLQKRPNCAGCRPSIEGAIQQR